MANMDCSGMRTRISFKNSQIYCMKIARPAGIAYFYGNKAEYP